MATISGRTVLIHLAAALVACLAFGVAARCEDKPGLPDATIQSDSVADRTIVARDLSEFRAATEMPAVSPALADAGKDDLVITYSDMPGTGNLTAVVLKPRPREGVYDIPEPPTQANVFRFLGDHLEEAAKKGVGLVRFPRGKTIAIAPPRIGALHLNLEGFTDTVIDLNGCTLRCTEPSTAIVIEKCHRMVLRNGTIHGSSLLATIARVEPDDTEAGIRFAVLPEYRAALEKSFDGKPQLITVGDAEPAPQGGWRMRVAGYSELFVNRGTKTNNFVYHEGSFVAKSPRDTSRPFEPGNHVWLLHRNNAGFGVLINNEDGNSDLSFEDLEFVNIPGMVIAGEVNRGIHVNRVKLRLDPDDPLAFFAASSDGIHINGNGGDVVIENCELGPNGDDKITNKGNYWAVTAIDPATKKITVEPPVKKSNINSWGEPGQKVIFIRGDFTVIGTSTLAGDPFRDTSKRHVLELTEIPPGVEIGTLVGNVDNAGARMVVRNNILRDTRAQGVLVQTQHVVVEDNTFEGIVGPAVKVALSLNDWYESVATGNILIRGNTFRRSSLSLRKSRDLIHLDQRNDGGEAVSVIDSVRIEGNKMEHE
ncbi:hypothetical protein SH528x_002772 [Novipirellula sp. SH528]|uniref:hypothetical protein n=1 Tax=Novipirellula sp. SH528 TaxID=3454466 RepID=UPI003FA157DB